MPAHKNPNAKPRKINFAPREIVKHKFPNPQNPKELLARFSAVWCEDDLPFEKSFRVLRQCYRQPYNDRLPLLDHIHHIAWLDLYGYASDGVMFTKEAMAAQYGIHYDKLTAILDRLEDVQLLYRIRLEDVQGYPIQHVLMTPLTKAKYQAGGCIPLYEAAERRHTRHERARLGHNHYPTRSIKLRELYEACGDEATVTILDNIVADIVFKHRPKRLTRPNFFQEFYRAAARQKLETNERIEAVAWMRKELYSGEI